MSIALQLMVARTKSPTSQSTEEAKYVHGVVKELASNEKNPKVAWRQRNAATTAICRLLIENHGVSGALSKLFPSASKRDRSVLWPNLAHDVITVAIALDLPHVMEAYSGQWSKSGFHAGLLPCPIAVAAISHDHQEYFHKLLAREDEATTEKPSDNERVYVARNYAIKAGQIEAARMIVSKIGEGELKFRRSEFEKVTELLVLGGCTTILKDPRNFQYSCFHPLSDEILKWATWHGRKELVQWALDDLGANIECRTPWYGTQLTCAASRGHESIVRLLLQKGAKPRPNGTHLFTITAAHGGYIGVLKAMLEYEESIGPPTDEDLLGALQVAGERGHPAFVELLLDRYGIRVPRYWEAKLHSIIELSELEGDCGVGSLIMAKWGPDRPLRSQLEIMGIDTSKITLIF